MFLEIITIKDYTEHKAKHLDNINEPIKSPIESRHGAHGNPQGVTFGIGHLTSKQTKLLDQLPKTGAQITVPKKGVSLKDLAAMTAVTGDEFAVFTKGGRRLIIRGDPNGVKFNYADAVKLHESGYRWSGHTHPYRGAENSKASRGDKNVLSAFKNQKHSVVIDSHGNRDVFEL